MIGSQSNHDIQITPDLTPLLDLIFIVMVFLLLTTNVRVDTMEINIPQTEQSQTLVEVDTPIVVIKLFSASNRWGLNEQIFNQWPQFTDALLTQINENPTKSLVVAADKNANVESMMRLLAFLQNNNIEATNIVMEENPL